MVRRLAPLLLVLLLTSGAAVQASPRFLPLPARGAALDRSAAPSGAADDRVGARQSRRRANEQRFQTLVVVRGALALVGFAILGWGVWLERRGLGGRLRALRLTVLCSVAVASFAGYYNFFQSHHPVGFKAADVFHYYMGSKYFEELGYFELYHCTLAALIEDGLQDPRDEPEVRDQRTLRIERPETTRRLVKECPARFDAARWSEFKRDLGFFRPRILGGSWRHLLVDHGYNPTPVWAFVGGLFSKNVPSYGEGFSWLIRLDRVLAIALGGVIVWAFGLEVACLAAIVWGTGPLWSYNWIGDAFLRNLWLFSALCGLALLRREKPFSAGVLLALAALLRIFPGIFIACYLAHAARHLRSRGITREARRLVAGVVVGSVILVGAGALGTGRGVGGYLEFREKMTGLVGQAGANKIGLSALANAFVHDATTFTVTNPEGREVRLARPAPVAVGVVRGVQGLLVLLGLLAFWRAMPRMRSWEIAALGFALIPLLSSPANYYYPFVLVAALLAGRRPEFGVALAALATVWLVTSLVFFLEPTRYLYYDAAAVIFSLGVLLLAAFSPVPSPSGEAASTRA